MEVIVLHLLSTVLDHLFSGLSLALKFIHLLFYNSDVYLWDRG